MSAPNAFADLIPTQAPAENSFADLIPKEQTNSFADLIPKQPDQSNSAFDPAMWSKVQGMKRGTKEHPSENYLTLTHIGSQLGFLGVHGFETHGHDPNGAHPTGDAVDFRTRDKSWEDGNQFIAQLRKMGLTVIDERRKPGQPHIHVQVPRGGVFKGDFTPFNETPPTPIEPPQTHGTPIPFTQAEKEQMGQRGGVYAPGTGPSTMSKSSSRPGEWAPGLHMDIPQPGEPWYELNKTGNPLDSLRQSARDAQSIINNTLYQIGIPIGPSFPGTQAAAEFVNPLNQGNFALGAVMEPGKTMQGMAESVQNITKPGASLDERIGGIFTLAMVTGGLHGAVEGAGAFGKAVKSGDLGLAGKVLTDSGVHPDLAQKFVEKAWNEKQIEDLTNQRIEIQARTLTKSGKPKANVNPKDQALLNTLDSQIQALKPSPVSETAPSVEAPETAPSAPANNVSQETPQSTGAYNASTDSVLREMGLDVPGGPARQKVLDWAQAARDKGYVENAAELARKALSEDQPLDHEQQIGIAQRLAAIRDEYKTADPVRRKAIEGEARILTDATRLEGTRWGREGVARQAEFNSGMDYLGLKLRFEDTAGRGMSPQEQAKFEQLANDHADTLKQLEDAKKRLAEVTEPKPKTPRKTSAAVQAEITDLHKQLNAKLGKTSANIDPEAFLILGKLVGKYVQKMGLSLVEAVTQVRAQHPEFSERDIRDAYLGPQRTSKPPTPETLAGRNAKRTARLLNNIEDLENGAVTPKQSRIKAQIPSDILDLLAKKKKLEDTAKMKILGAAPKSGWQRVAGLIREGFLSSPAVFSKLLSYDATEIPAAIAKDIVTPAFGKLKVKGGKTLAELSPTQAGFSAKATLGRVLSPLSKEAWKNAYDSIVTGVDKFSELKGDVPAEYGKSIMGRTHQAMKQLIGTAEYKAAITRGFQYAEKKGWDLKDPATIQELHFQAAKDASNVMLRGVNEVADLMNRAPRTAKGQSLTKNFFGFIAETLAPFRRVPLNLFKHTLDYTGAGLARGEYLRRFGKEVTPELAKEINGAYARGAVGTALMLYTWGNPDWLDKVPKPFLHHPALAAALMISVIRKTYDATGNKEDAATKGADELIKHSPYGYTLQQTGKALFGNKATKEGKYSERSVAAGNLARNYIPGAGVLAQVSRAEDRQPGHSFMGTLLTGEGAQPRKTNNFLDVLKEGTVLRTELPIKHPAITESVSKELTDHSVTLPPVGNNPKHTAQQRQLLETKRNELLNQKLDHLIQMPLYQDADHYHKAQLLKMEIKKFSYGWHQMRNERR